MSILGSATRKFSSIKMLSSQVSTLSTLPKFQTLAVTSPKPFVVHVALNRPDKMNAMNRNMWLEVKDCFDNLSSEPDCRVIILTGGEAKLFCAGIDLYDLMNLGTAVAEHDDIARKSIIIWRAIKTYQDCLTSLEKCHKPVIAAIHGGCIGAGLNMVCAADIRYCTSDAYFQNMEVQVGMAADVGVLQRMPKVMGNASLVNELAYTARKFPADEAKENGFVSKVFDSKESLLSGALETAETIASKSPVAVQGTKRTLVFSRDHSVSDGLDHIALYNMAMLQSEDFLNAATAQATKGDPPVFSKL